MALFKVLNIVDGNTIETDGWKWGEDYAGTRVKIAGYKVSGTEHVALAKRRLQILLEGKSVELRNPTDAVKGPTNNSDVVTAAVYLNDVDIAQYFPELKTA